MTERRLTRHTTRAFVRYHVFHPREGRLFLGPLDFSRSRDVGPGGLFLAGAHLPLGTRLHLFVSLVGDEAAGCLEAFGEVVHARPRLDASGHETAGVGVEFTWMAPEARRRLDRWLEQRRSIDQAVVNAALARARAEARLAS